MKKVTTSAPAVQCSLNDGAPLQNMVQPLLTWYDNHARILPWRENTQPYRVWVSEIMLQQTRVEAVKPYFERFISALPTIESLANAPEEQLLKLWEGLGYYARVRNLQKAAKVICQQYGGNFPHLYEQVLDLPGIGSYTAGAICSISFKQPIPAVDGNVLRVMARLTQNEQDILSQKMKREVFDQLKQIYPQTRSGDFTQSLMELGATICIPNGAPKCDICPLKSLCCAYANETQMALPVKSPKKARKKENRTVFLLYKNQYFAIHKRPSKGLLSGLWEFLNTQEHLTPEQAINWLNTQGISVKSITATPDKKHIFTHIEWHMVGYLVECAQTGNSQLEWVTKDKLENQMALPTAFRQFIACLPDKTKNI